jgi:hypothetical protein
VQELRLERLERQEMEEVEAPTPTPSVETDSDSAVEQNTTAAAPQVEVRFFLWEKLAALF